MNLCLLLNTTNQPGLVKVPVDIKHVGRILNGPGACESVRAEQFLRVPGVSSLLGVVMLPIPPMIFESIARFMRENYQPQDISKTKEEAQWMADQVRKEAAGRIPTQIRMSKEEREALLQELQHIRPNFPPRT